MAEPTSYQTSKGVRWMVRYRDPDRKSREKGGFATKKEATTYLAKVVVASDRGEYVDPKSGKVTVRELGVEWIASQSHLKPSSYRPLETAWRIHIEPAWGDRRLSDIRHSEVRAFFTKFHANEGKTRSASVVIRAYGVLAAILDVAVLDRRISVNPARGVKMPRKGKKKRAYLTPGQVETLAKHAGENSTLIYVLAYTGIRWGEAIGLRLSSLDTLRRRMQIEENAVLIGSEVIVGTPKTHEHRSVSYPKFLSEPLARACEGKRRGQLVFGGGDAYFARAQAQSGWFAAMLAAAQAEDKDIPYLTPHDLRHTAASMAISAGANPKAVQRMLGHASAAMTLDTYADLFEDDLDAVSERMDAVRTEMIVGSVRGLRA